MLFLDVNASGKIRLWNINMKKPSLNSEMVQSLELDVDMVMAAATQRHSMR
jgi:hypothetical protein